MRINVRQVCVKPRGRRPTQTVSIQRKVITTRQARHILVPELFGLCARADYANAIRELVGNGVVQRDDQIGVKDDERLRFLEAAQSSLLGS